MCLHQPLATRSLPFLLLYNLLSFSSTSSLLNSFGIAPPLHQIVSARQWLLCHSIQGHFSVSLSSRLHSTLLTTPPTWNPLFSWLFRLHTSCHSASLASPPSTPSQARPPLMVFVDWSSSGLSPRPSSLLLRFHPLSLVGCNSNHHWSHHAWAWYSQNPHPQPRFLFHCAPHSGGFTRPSSRVMVCPSADPFLTLSFWLGQCSSKSLGWKICFLKFSNPSQTDIFIRTIKMKH